MEVGGVAVVQLVRILRGRLNLALNQLRPARRDIKAILAADPNSPQVCVMWKASVQEQKGRQTALAVIAYLPSVPSLHKHCRGTYTHARVMQECIMWNSQYLMLSCITLACVCVPVHCLFRPWH